MPSDTATSSTSSITAHRQIDTRSRQSALIWLAAGQQLVEASPGCVEASWKANEADSHSWTMIARFTTSDLLGEWAKSPLRQQWLETGNQHLVTSTTHIEHDQADMNSLARQRVPPRWKQMIAIFLVFFPLSLAANSALSALVGSLPLWLRVLIAVLTVTPIMTYLALPFINRILHHWLMK